MHRSNGGVPLRSWGVRICAAIALAASSPALAGQQDAGGSEAQRVVPRIANQIEAHYPFADIAGTYATRLRAALAQHRYDRLTGAELARAINADLQSVHRDLHLGVHYSHALFVQATDETTGTPTPEGAAQEAAARREANYGFTDVAVDPMHSTAYIRSTGPWWNERETFATAAGALALAAGSDNVIIDIRDNPGGAGEVGRFLASYFFPDGDEKFYLSGFGRDPSQNQQEWTYAYVPGRRLPDARLYILVNGHTGSAAEGFAFAMQRLGRATIVGATTAGAGIAGSLVPLQDDLVLFLPVKMVVAPGTTTGWEGTGVVPDMMSGDRDARAVAQEAIQARRGQASEASPRP